VSWIHNRILPSHFCITSMEETTPNNVFYRLNRILFSVNVIHSKTLTFIVFLQVWWVDSMSLQSNHVTKKSDKAIWIPCMLSGSCNSNYSGVGWVASEGILWCVTWVWSYKNRPSSLPGVLFVLVFRPLVIESQGDGETNGGLELDFGSNRVVRQCQCTAHVLSGNNLKIMR